MTEDSPALEIPPPREDRPPMKANLLNAMQKANTSLTPLFPYMHPGAIVPTGALFIGQPGKDYGQFYHHNTVDEVIIAFVAEGGNLRTGQLYNGGRVHGVNSFMKDQTKDGSFVLFSVTQRQADPGEAQTEAISLLCEACRKPLFKAEFDATPGPEARELEHPFPSINAPPERLAQFNADPAQRECPECGHDNPPFPLHQWGWADYAEQSKVMARAKQLLLAAGEG